AQLYPTLGHGPSLTVAVKTLLVAREDLDQNLVYQLAMATDRMKPEIASAYPLAGVETLGKSRSAARALPWHPGARRYIDRELPSLIEQYAEFVGATVTMTIAVVSLLVAVYRRRRQARKDRLDTYYQQLLTCRTALRDSGANTAAIETTLYELQEEVFELLIAERIDADSALLAFLSLSNQLLIEAKSAAPVAHNSA
ncbi:MAG: TAXI family TRAP transporter solute-binding subunit, partial [Halieaceae bacterium]